MRSKQVWLLAMGWVVVAGMAASAAGQEPGAAGKTKGASGDAVKIRLLIPAAAAVAREDMDRLARSATASDLEEKSLTLMVLSLRPGEDEKAKEQFRFLGQRIPRPSDLAREFYRGDVRVGKVFLRKGPVTLIHADRITECTCEVDGDTARGTVSFVVPKLYQGKVDYVARRSNDRWQITEFIMSAYEIHIVRDGKGEWVEKAAVGAKKE